MKIGILWDLDGTLLDTLQDLTDGTNAAMTAHSLPLRTVDEVRRFVGNGARRLIEQAVDGKADVDAVLSSFHSYYNTHCQNKTAPYEGILAALKVLGQEFPMAIVSNKPDAAVKTLCAQYFPGLYARGESADCPRKPKPDMVFKAMASIGADACIYVGDSEVDVETARNAGVPCLSVLWGFRDKETLTAAGADHFCAAPAALPAVIRAIAGEMEE